MPLGCWDCLSLHNPMIGRDAPAGNQVVGCRKEDKVGADNTLCHCLTARVHPAAPLQQKRPRPSPGKMYLPSLSNKSPDKIYTVATYRDQPKTSKRLSYRFGYGSSWSLEFLPRSTVSEEKKRKRTE